MGIVSLLQYTMNINSYNDQNTCKLCDMDGGYLNMDQNISVLNIQLAPRLHDDLETFLTLCSSSSGSWLRISSDDMRFYAGGVSLLIGQSDLTRSREFDCKEVMVALSMSVGSIEITDWRSELLRYCSLKNVVFLANHRHWMWMLTNENKYCRRWILDVGVKFYQRSQYKYYYRSDYKVRHKMCKPISRHGPTATWCEQTPKSRHFQVSFLCVIFRVLLVISRGQEPWNVLDYQKSCNIFNQRLG